jgi:hypothetical protein
MHVVYAGTPPSRPTNQNYGIAYLCTPLPAKPGDVYAAKHSSWASLSRAARRPPRRMCVVADTCAMW